MAMSARYTRRRAKIRPVHTDSSTATQPLPSLSTMASRCLARRWCNHLATSSSQLWFGTSQKQSNCSTSNGMFGRMAQTSTTSRPINLASLSSESEEISTKEDDDDFLNEPNGEEKRSFSSAMSTGDISSIRGSGSSSTANPVNREARRTRKRWPFCS
ncbi:hypothetical protein FBUS_06857 [Fasciolopsis buskii]|uniref:Uncharacterized protein n=1 Tax=Fasciolopsis buskii TaxID=27845 RepID=A0A8E0RSM1_9TREM|nr:hypothetical protein FBUS_06857 [Fasciolopsis buski]